jgi:hypothetical protein
MPGSFHQRQQASGVDRAVIGVVGTRLMGVNAGRVGLRSGAGFYEWDDAYLARIKEGRKQVMGRG